MSEPSTDSPLTGENRAGLTLLIPRVAAAIATAIVVASLGALSRVEARSALRAGEGPTLERTIYHPHYFRTDAAAIWGQSLENDK